MGNVSEKIRGHIGEGELSDAVDTLCNFLKTSGGDLYNRAIHLKGRYKEYSRNRDLGMGDNQEEKSRISMAVLHLADELEKARLEHTPTVREFEQNKPINAPAYPSYQPVNQPTGQGPFLPKQTAVCQFYMDTMQYHLYENGQIFMFNPFNNQSMPVGMKMPSQNPYYAWTIYFTTTNIYYLVDQAGIIWGQNYGMPAQYGTVRYL